jgi:hypothetical protein
VRPIFWACAPQKLCVGGQWSPEETMAVARMFAIDPPASSRQLHSRVALFGAGGTGHCQLEGLYCRPALVAPMAEANAKIAEIELQIIQIDQDLRSEVGKELADIRARRRRPYSGAAHRTKLLHCPHRNSAKRTATPRRLKACSRYARRAFVQTARRTALSYLIKPLSDQVARAFREVNCFPNPEVPKRRECRVRQRAPDQNDSPND